MKKFYALLFILFFGIQNSQSQNLRLSVYSEISIITIGPGDALFETFGHNAIRVKDPILRWDYVYNYGTFDFNDPQFYSNFAKGRLLYWLSVSRYERFKQSYTAQKRWTKQQVLDLTQEERQAFFDFLQKNALPQNASYRYDPYYDNCSTKLRDITQEILKEKVEFSSEYAEEGLSLRQLMNRELPWNTWGSFGINTALGSKLDNVASAAEYMYLPDYVYLAFKDAKKVEGAGSTSLIKSEELLIDFEEKNVKINWLVSPFLAFSVIFLLVVYLSRKDVKKGKRTKLLDFLLFLVTGIVGALLVFLWFFTDHSTTPNNFNVLWAFAPNIIVAFTLLKKTIPNWVKLYLKFYLILLLILPVVWMIGLQLFTLALVPFLLTIIYRVYTIQKLLTSVK